MSIPTLELIGLLCMCKIITMLVILILLVQNTFLKKLKHLLTIIIIIIIIIKNIITNIFRVQAYSSIMCGYFCIGFIDFMLAGKTLTEYTNLFSPNNLMI